jgi:multidrug efflux pump subunit AcrB
MIVLAGLATIIFWLTSILPKEKDITETQQSIFFEMTLNRANKIDRTGSEINQIHKMAQVRIHETESLTSSADFILMEDDRDGK